ncbi:hypothetical protein CLAFUW4_09557 [Fulvia fulva]|uniref:Rad60/SUMO-like domain-containing protein n=1 Tax=Passalora fulva TaxID=5499 RepID=A0A9Q8PGZ2_PASFU|nr:uncharacterized protein CLAFUR5_09652 [Fulvia fulva]KAK4613558.1 hypothetical protein CLAFUR4_09563 [Fulvia fulva]KAK4615006.1 hypothetical protein CLAFUR0_09554 [Fulvia fulva]UJO22231.1 hypothetical protein CLAFUR5_09652 [Fulvia fulva]WPV20695.1 hypothetical protein CLAFUW4_09557 [Fulvia fulva]WPV34905.1 hypothetical protein CLAFUW7_09558 [Fulvia fulva]
MDSLPAHNPMKVLDRDPIVKADPGYVNICFASRSSSFALTFKVRKSHMFKDVKAAFGACTDQQPGGLVYTFKGQVVEDANTSEQLRLKNGDMVEVAAVGDADFTGACSEHRRVTELDRQGFQCISVMNAGESLVVKVRLLSGYTQPYCIKPNTQMSKLVADFEQQVGEQDLRFITFDGDHLHGRRNCTAENAEIEDGDTIDVFREQIGGGGTLIQKFEAFLRVPQRHGK